MRNTSKKKDYTRTISISIDPANIHRDGIVLDLNNPRLMSWDKDEMIPLLGESRLEIRRPRANKPDKVLHVSESSGTNGLMDSNHQLLSYDHVIAVDTNTRHFAGTTISITAVHHIKPGEKTGNICRLLESVLALVEFWGAKENPERIGWWLVLQCIEANPLYFAGNVALVVDSALGDHTQIRERNQPIIRDYYLPESVNLVYGSDQGGQEHLTTKLIRYCDKLSSDIFRHGIPQLRVKGLVKAKNEPYRYYRQWETDRSGTHRFHESFQ